MSGSCRQVSSTADGSDCIPGFLPDTPAGPSQTITYDHHLYYYMTYLYYTIYTHSSVLEECSCFETEPTKSQKRTFILFLIKFICISEEDHVRKIWMEYMRINAEAEGNCLCHHASACPNTKDTAVSFWKMQKSPSCPEEVLWKLACCTLMVGIACRCGFGCLQITKNAIGPFLNDPRDFHLLLVRVDSIILPPASLFNVFKQFQCVSGFDVNLVEVIQDPWLRPTRPQKKVANYTKYLHL